MTPTITTPTLDFNQLVKLLAPNWGRFSLRFDSTAVWPPKPDELPSEMMDDIRHVIESIASQYVDPSCVSLHFDELVQEGLMKLAKLIDSDVLNRLRNRTEFFAFFKTSVNNHIRGLVQRHRMTIKRTGHKPPPKSERNNPNYHVKKPVEISLNDEDAHLQIGEIPAAMTHCDRELISDVRKTMTPLQRVVFDAQVNNPPWALQLAEMESYVGLEMGKALDVRVKPCHMAAALGMTESLYRSISEEVKKRVLVYMQERETETDEKFQYNASIAALEKAFDVQAPRFCDDQILIRRMFTIAARVNSDKITSELTEHLKVVGARVPEVRGPMLNCFGVLWKDGQKPCEHCNASRACMQETKNYGLEMITFSTTVLPPSKQVRTPVLLPSNEQLGATEAIEAIPPVEETAVVEPPAPPVERRSPLSSVVLDTGKWSQESRDEEIAAYIKENFSIFKMTTPTGVNHGVKHKEQPPSKKRRVIFVIKNLMKIDHGLELHFCNPASEVTERLKAEGIKKNSLPPSMPASEAIKLIDLHAKNTFV